RLAELREEDLVGIRNRDLAALDLQDLLLLRHARHDTGRGSRGSLHRKSTAHYAGAKGVRPVVLATTTDERGRRRRPPMDASTRPSDDAAPRRVLIVANRTAGGTPLRDALLARAMAELTEFMLVVPATPPTDGW